MKLINCPACEKECSPQAITCPNCGHPFTQRDTLEPRAKKGGGIWKALTICLAGIIVISLAGYIAISFFGVSTNRLTEVLRGSKSGLNEKQQKVAQDAITELRKLAAATDVGISKSSYSSMLISAKAVAERAIRELPDGELKKGIGDTFDAFKDAHVLWDVMKDDTAYWACPTQPDPTGKDELQRKLDVLRCHPVGGDLARKYKIPFRHIATKEIVYAKDIDEKKGTAEVIKSEGLSIIWTEARLRLEVTSELFSKLTSTN